MLRIGCTKEMSRQAERHELNAFDDAEQIIREVVEKLKREYQPHKVVLFGSYAYGVADGDSDIDLLVVKETNERPIDRRVRVSGIISDPNRRTPVEVLVLTPEELRDRLECGDAFVSEILTRGRILYEA